MSSTKNKYELVYDVFGRKDQICQIKANLIPQLIVIAFGRIQLVRVLKVTSFWSNDRSSALYLKTCKTQMPNSSSNLQMVVLLKNVFNYKIKSRTLAKIIASSIT